MTIKRSRKRGLWLFGIGLSMILLIAYIIIEKQTARQQASADDDDPKVPKAQAETKAMDARGERRTLCEDTLNTNSARIAAQIEYLINLPYDVNRVPRREMEQLGVTYYSGEDPVYAARQIIHAIANVQDDSYRRILEYHFLNPAMGIQARAAFDKYCVGAY